MRKQHTTVRRGERGAITKAWESVIPVALVYPNSYTVGMGNLGFQHVYARFNSHPSFLCERFFTATGGNQPLFSEESGRVLGDFRIIAFSVPFENDYPWVPTILASAGIPQLSADRGRDHPLVIAGGVSVSMNPEPLALFLDLVFIGEIEDESEPGGFLATLSETATKPSRAWTDRADILRSFAAVLGVYVPSAYSFRYGKDQTIAGIDVLPGFPPRVKALKRRQLKSSVPVSVLFSPDAQFGESLLVEVGRGCGRGCRFCAAGWIHSPVRHAPFDSFRAHVEAAVQAGTNIGLIGSDLASHPSLEDIMALIVDGGGTFSLSSIRPEGLTPSTMRLLARTGQKTATLAPETATDRMKKIIGKQIPSERFLKLVDLLVRAGIPNIRFYFMLGLPGENDEDAQAIVDFALESRKVFVDASRPMRRIGRISIQLNPFIPKPWTPFQWTAMAHPPVLQKRLNMVSKALKKTPNVTVRAESVRQAVLQAVLARGDRRICPALLHSSNDPVHNTRISRKGSQEAALYAHRERTAEELFPWEVTDHGVSRRVLRTIFENALPK